MHRTNHPHIYSFIDQKSLSLSKKQNSIILELSGWAFHYDMLNNEGHSYPIQVKILSKVKKEISGGIFNCESNRRVDVSEFYRNGGNPALGSISVEPDCGFEGKFTLDLVSLGLKLGEQFYIDFTMEVPISEGSSEIYELNFENKSFFTLSSRDFSSMIIEGDPSTLFKDNERETGLLPTYIVIDNFYADPDAVRKFALEQEFEEHPTQHKGKRTNGVYRTEEQRLKFERILRCKIDQKAWNDSPDTHGCFQYCLPGDKLVYHCDLQTYAGIIFLTPDAPPECGTSLFRSKVNKVMRPDDPFAIKRTGKSEVELATEIFKNGFYDETQFELVDKVGNIYNRLVLFNGKNIHAASGYFGDSKENGRLFQLFFFDIKK